MDVSQDSLINELRLRIKLLEKQRHLSAGSLEDKLLLWLVSETINQSSAPNELMYNLIERISAILDIPLGICCEVRDNLLFPYTTISGTDAENQLQIVIELTQRNLHTDGDEPFFIDVEKTDGTYYIGVFPFQSLYIPSGVFIFFENVNGRQKLKSVSLVIQQLIQMGITKFEKLNLLDELKELNYSFESKVRDRTQDLNKNLKKLTHEISELKKPKDNSVKIQKVKQKPTLTDTGILKDIGLEIRTPMNGILGFSEILRDEKIPTDERNDYIDIIKSCANSLIKIVDDALSFSTVGGGEIEFRNEEFPLTPFLTEIYDKFKKDELYRQRQNLELRLNININGNTILYADRYKLQQVFDNLIGNAIKFTGEGYVEFGCYLNKDKKAKKEITFFVKDTGIGISKELGENIFEPFYKREHEISKLYGGMGLGLTISRHIVKAFGGKIWYNSEPGEGSQFYFTIPESVIVKSADNHQSGLLHGVNGFNWKKKKILIVEDDEMSFVFLKEILKDTEVLILRAKNGKQGIEMARENPDIDLILMDIKLPGIDGYEATGIIKGFMNVPVIAQTAYAMMDDHKKSLEVGCDEYISKPINRRKLLKIINDMLVKYEHK